MFHPVIHKKSFCNCFPFLVYYYTFSVCITISILSIVCCTPWCFVHSKTMSLIIFKLTWIWISTIINSFTYSINFPILEEAIILPSILFNLNPITFRIISEFVPLMLIKLYTILPCTNNHQTPTTIWVQA